MTETGAGSTENCVNEDCGCKTVSCVEGDPACFNPNEQFISNNFSQNSHIIKVQFHAINYHPDHWERVFGAAFDGEPLTKSNIDVAIFDINPASKLQRKHGTATFDSAEEVQVVFSSPLNNSSYSLNMTANKNVKLWFTNKTANGFTIKSSKAFSGFVDWTAIQLNN